MQDASSEMQIDLAYNICGMEMSVSNITKEYEFVSQPSAASILVHHCILYGRETI